MENSSSSEINPSDPGDPCNNHDWSVVFIFMMVLAIIAWFGAAAVTLSARNSHGGLLTGLHKLCVLLAFAALLQFGPMLSSSLHSGHNIYSYSQTGCKLLFYTEYGTRHVITGLVLSLLAYCYYGIHHGFESMDGKISSWGWGWLILAMVAVQGLFGMVPAMYVDLAPDGQSCGWTTSMPLTLGHVVSMELVLRPITPYLLPGLLCIYPLICVGRLRAGVTEERKHATVTTILCMVVSYFILNAPYSLNLLVEYALRLSYTSYDWVAICNLKWFFFLIHQSWFLLAPCILLLGDPHVEKTSLRQWTNKIRKMYDDKVRLI